MEIELDKNLKDRFVFTKPTYEKIDLKDLNEGFKNYDFDDENFVYQEPEIIRREIKLTEQDYQFILDNI